MQAAERAGDQSPAPPPPHGSSQPPSGPIWLSGTPHSAASRTHRGQQPLSYVALHINNTLRKALQKRQGTPCHSTTIDMSCDLLLMRPIRTAAGFAADRDRDARRKGWRETHEVACMDPYQLGCGVRIGHLSGKATRGLMRGKTNEMAALTSQ